MEARCVGESGGAGFWVDGTCLYPRVIRTTQQTITKLLDNQSVGEESKCIDVYDNHDDYDNCGANEKKYRCRR
eukprot:scaffold52343_cov47-Cyclotella_meneghiniana.AAC.1